MVGEITQLLSLTDNQVGGGSRGCKGGGREVGRGVSCKCTNF